jgi:predicted ATP-grasp superfamily ATP-dependent carboligase
MQCFLFVYSIFQVPERPAAESAIDFIKEYLGAPIGVDIDELRKTVERQKEELVAKDKTIMELTAKIEELMKQNPAAPAPEK